MTGWVKSSFSSGSGECVEVRLASPTVAVRDSKHTRLVTVPAPCWAAFVAMITRR
jgi:Domain of unknown function (DUF397)